jgi:VanZ family protein
MIRRNHIFISGQFGVIHAVVKIENLQHASSPHNPLPPGFPIRVVSLARNADITGTVRRIVRALAWFGVSAILILSVVPANERPVTGIGQGLEHFTAFGLVAGAFAMGYRLPLIQLLQMALLFCGAIELLQVPLPTRHARVSDFFIDFLGSCVAIVLVALGHKINSHLSSAATKPS